MTDEQLEKIKDATDRLERERRKLELVQQVEAETAEQEARLAELRSQREARVEAQLAAERAARVGAEEAAARHEAALAQMEADRAAAEADARRQHAETEAALEQTRQELAAARAQIARGAAAAASTADAAPARMPREIHSTDGRFGQVRAEQRVRCDRCRWWFDRHGEGDFPFANGPLSWDFRHHQRRGEPVDRLPDPRERERLWNEGAWNASWWCLGCFGEAWGLDRQQVQDRLRWTDRNVKRFRPDRNEKRSRR